MYTICHHKDSNDPKATCCFISCATAVSYHQLSRLHVPVHFSLYLLNAACPANNMLNTSLKLDMTKQLKPHLEHDSNPFRSPIKPQFVDLAISPNLLRFIIVNPWLVITSDRYPVRPAVTCDCSQAIRF